MNLDDLVLLRGWINHIEWTELDSQIPEAGASSRKKIKDLRRQLAMKARFYGKSEQVEFWLGERGHTETWERLALAALNDLNSLAEPVPDLEQSVDQWFPESVCAALPAKAKTLADVVDLLEAVFAGDSPLTETLKPVLKTLTAFFDKQALPLGYQLNKKPKSTALPVPLHALALMERVLIPIERNGAQGSNRSPEPCRIHANHDLDAINSWLSLKDDNAKTYQAYKKELERLLLWALLERGKPISSLNTDDCRAYIQFLKRLTTADSGWVTLEPANKSYGKWKPFYYRDKKSEPGSSTGSPDLPKPVLSPKSINYAKTVIASCMEWLVKQNYLKHNNFQ